jgi:subtilisin family serine protease
MAGKRRRRKTYYVGGRPVALVIDPTWRAVRVPAQAEPMGNVDDTAAELPLAEVGTGDTADVGTDSGGFRVPGYNFVIYPVQPPAPLGNGGPTPGEAALAMGPDGGPANGAAERDWPVFRLGRDHRALAADQVLVGSVEGVEVEPLVHAALTRRLGADGYSFRPRAPRNGTVLLHSGTDPFVVSSILRRTRGIRFAEPDFVTLFNPVPPDEAGLAPAIPVPGAIAASALMNAVAPAAAKGATATPDPFEALQVQLRRMGAFGAQEGRREVVVAVLDARVDVDHPDLQTAVIGTKDVLPPNSGDEADGHATACAGLAAASAGNGQGGRGVAAGCGLLPVRFARATRSTSITRTSGSVLDVAKAIDAAWQGGAWVISLSWVFAEATEITDAIKRAREQGRKKLGCVVVAGVGNDGGGVHFPARLEGVLGVGACTDNDEPKTRTSSDLQRNWSSCFGERVSLVAPGLAHLTTDARGPLGYNARAGANGDYVANFRGTSASTAIVAGAAALVLCANPCLREEQVREILCKEAFRPPAHFPDPKGHHIRLGFGRLDVGAAVNEARRMLATGEVPCPEKTQ